MGKAGEGRAKHTASVVSREVSVDGHVILRVEHERAEYGCRWEVTQQTLTSISYSKNKTTRRQGRKGGERSTKGK